MILAVDISPYRMPPGEMALMWSVYLAPLLLAGVFGLIVGSFINVVAWRSPRMRSLLDPPSHCYACGTLLEPRVNIPVWSWLTLRGQCAYCKAPFSSRYAWVELLTGLVFVALLFFRFYWEDLPGPNRLPSLHLGPDILPWLAKAYLFAAVLLIIAIIDTEFRYIFDSFTIPGMVLGLLTAPITFMVPECVAGWTTAQFYLDSFYGLLLGIGLVGVFHVISPRGMGLGDVMFAGMLGAFLGWRALLAGLLVSIYAGGLAAILVMLTAILQRRYKPGTLVIPFGPYLAIGALTALLFGCQWFERYTASLKPPGPPAEVSLYSPAEGGAAVRKSSGAQSIWDDGLLGDLPASRARISGAKDLHWPRKSWYICF